MNRLLKKIICILSVMVLLSSCSSTPKSEKDLTKMTIEEIVDSLSLEEKAAQMLQPACYQIDNRMMKEKCYGSILSNSQMRDDDDWRNYVDGFQKAALASKAVMIIAMTAEWE